MTDDELIQLLAETPPEELSAEQIEAIQARLPESAALRASLADHLLLDQTLHHALGRVRFSLDAILAREPIAAGHTFGSWRLAAIAAAAALVALVSGLAWWLHGEGDRNQIAFKNPPVVQPIPPATPPDVSPPQPTQPTSPPSPPGSPPGAPPMPADVKTPPPVPAGTNEPWTAQLAEPVRSFEQTAFELPQFDENAVDALALERWWQTLSGQQQVQLSGSRRNIRGLNLEGLFRLRAPWPGGTALKIALQSRPLVRFHVWADRDGATFELIERNGTTTWTAYQSQRSNSNQPLPDRLAIHTVDVHRYRWLGNGVVEFRHQDGQVVLSCGDLLIAAVPLAAPPQSVYVETDKRSPLLIGAMRLVRSAPFPLVAPTVSPQVTERQPSKLPLAENLLGEGKLTKRDSGELMLSGDDLKQPAVVAWPVDDPGWRMFDLEIEGASPGTGVFVGDAVGRPAGTVGVFYDKRLKQPILNVSQLGERNWETNSDPGRGPVSALGQRQWLRFLVRQSKLRVLTSADGVRWSEALPVQGHALRAQGTLGMYLAAGRGARSITVRSFRTVALIELPALCSGELRAQMPDFANVDSVPEWYRTVLQSKPADVDLDRWRLACAAHCLSQGLPPTAAGHAWDTLLDAARHPALPWDSAVRLLDELAVAVDPSNPAALSQLVQAYEDVAWNAWRAGETRPLSRIRVPLLTAPLPTYVGYDPLSSPLAKMELIGLVHAGKWNEIRQSARVLQFFGNEFPEPRRSAGRDATKRIVTWAEALAHRNRPAEETAAAPAAIPPAWRHPLIEQLGKEGYNVLAELESALAGGALKDACQIISSMTADQAVGLLPNARDGELLVSLPGAVALAMRDHPELARTMQSDFGQLAELRLRQAAVEADAQVMQALTTQFHSTTAAAEAQVWLGDRALARGDLRRADAYYRAAMPGVSLPTRPNVAARLRLVAAMNGRIEGEPPINDVRLGDTELSPPLFERLVADAVRSADREPIDTLAEPESPAPLAKLPTPAAYEAVKLATLDAAAGRDPGALPRRDIDLLGPQTSVTVAAPRFVVSSRFSIAAFDPSTGQRLWQQPMDADQGRTFAWPLVAMKPVVAGPVTLARRLAGWGPELACFDTATGELRWRSPRNEMVASDPLVLAARIAAVTLTQVQQDVLQLMLTSYDPRSGKVLSQQPIVQLRDLWNRELPVAAQAVGDTVLVVAGGCIIGCDLEGNPRWLRRQTWLWGVNDGRAIPVRFDPPLVDGDRAIIAQPGVPNLTCVDVHTGRLEWQQVLPDNSKSMRLIGLGGGRVYVQVADQLLAYSRETGNLLWRQIVPAMCEAQTVDAAGDLLLTVGEKSAAKLYGIKLVWLDGASGTIRDTAYVRSYSSEQPWFGPWVIHQGRLFAVVGGEPVGAPVMRNIVELKPLAESPTDGAPLPLPTLAWSASRQQPVLPTTLAGWTVLQSGGGEDRPPGFRAESDGRANVFQTMTTSAKPLYLARRVEAIQEAGKKRKLRLEFVTPNDSTAWRLEILWNGRLLHSFPPEKQPAVGSYRQEVELPSEAGWLFLVERHTGAGGTVALWRHLELVEYNR